MRYFVGYLCAAGVCCRQWCVFAMGIARRRVLRRGIKARAVFAPPQAQWEKTFSGSVRVSYGTIFSVGTLDV